MRITERWNYLKRAPPLLWDILFRGRYDFTYDLIPIHTSDMSIKKRLNMLKAGINLIHRRTHPWSWPIHIHIELTNYCNLRCKVCPTGTGILKRQPKAIEPALVESLMKEIGPCLLTSSLWGWGESLLHPQLADILRIIRNYNFTTFLSTNGQNLNEDSVLQALVSHPPTYLIVCLDGVTEETNSILRVGSKLDLALTGVRRIARIKQQRGLQLPILQLRYIVMKHNEHEVPKIPEFAKKNQFDQLTVRTLSIIDAPEDIHRSLIPDDVKYRAYSYTDNQRVRRTDFVCEKAFSFPAVFADGTIVACDQDYNAKHPLGNLADGSSFADIWWSQKAAEIRKTIRDNPKQLSCCHNCPFRDRPISTSDIRFNDLRNETDFMPL